MSNGHEKRLEVRIYKESSGREACSPDEETDEGKYRAKPCGMVEEKGIIFGCEVVKYEVAEFRVNSEE